MMSGLPGARTIGPLALIFKLNNGLIGRSLEGLSDEAVWRQPVGGGNPIGWIVGHVTEARASLLSALGAPFETGWGKRFARGAALQAAAAYPDRGAVEAAWSATRRPMRDAFAALTDARLAEPSPGPPRPGVQTVADLIAFCAFHESYHVGQAGYLRKLLGYTPVAD